MGSRRIEIVELTLMGKMIEVAQYIGSLTVLCEVVG